jgi:hypothetical protein
MYIQANIGRNVTNAFHVIPPSDSDAAHPMSDYLWGVFQDMTKRAIRRAMVRALPESFDLRDVTVDSFETHTGIGSWEGQTEESAHVSIYLDHDGHTFDNTGWHNYQPALRLALDHELSRLAHQWDQEAIAYLVTDSGLAMAEHTDNGRSAAEVQAEDDDYYLRVR